MVNYNSQEDVKSGVPLGGIGAGKIEILPSGILSFFTYQNNWRQPIGDAKEGNYGNHFAIFVEQDSRKICKLLQTVKVRDYPCIEEIEYTGEFPVAQLKYQDKNLPVDLFLEASSSLVPYDYKNSGLPGAVFLFKVKNTTDKSLTVSLMATGRNTVGLNTSTGRYNEVFEDQEKLGVTFKVKNPLPHDFTAGEVSISVPKKAGQVSYLGEWNLKSDPFILYLEAIKIDAWEYFNKDGTLPNVNTKQTIEGRAIEWGGALAVKFSLASGEEKEIPFVYSWYTPNHYVGHIYEKWFGSSKEVASFLINNRIELRHKTKKWQEIIKKAELADWLKDALLNNLYVLFSSSWWGRNNEFVLYEAPIICPLMGTLDVGFYGTIPVSLLFPELEFSYLNQFRQAQRPSGYIPHDLGYERVDLANDGTTSPPQWKDLNSKFVLMAYRDYLWSGNSVFINDFYPSIKKALQWLFTTDKNKDFLPDNEGADQTFDLWKFYNTNAYTSGLFLAALRVTEEIAKLNKDEEFAAECREWFTKGKKSFEEELWTGEFYKNCSGNQTGDISCTLSQLNGQWYAHMLNLGYIVDQERVKTALKNIIELNGTKCPYGALNSVLPDGTIDKTSNHSRVIWPAMNYVFAALAIYEGFAEAGLMIAKKVWDNISLNIKNPWNQPDVIYADNGSYGFGDYYMRNMAVWAIFIALAAKDEKLKEALNKMKP